jgi:hypothetical protein
MKNEKALAAEQFYGLAQLTWITVTPGGEEATAPKYWKKTTVPGLQDIFGLEGDYEKLSDIVVDLPPRIRNLVAAPVGFSNFYSAYRRSCLEWLRQHRRAVATIFAEAAQFRTDRQRYGTARRVDALPPIPRGGGRGAMHPNSLLTPVVACLDPSSRFPVANNAQHVKDLLEELGVDSRDTSTRIRAMMGFINLASIPDAFYLDAAGIHGELKRGLVRRGPGRKEERWSNRGAVSSTREFPKLGWGDVETTEFIRKMKSVKIQNVHKHMTNALHKLFTGKRDVRRGRRGQGDFDVLVRNYSGEGRDLLIEVKSLADLMAARLAVGQLFDYRRYVIDPATTDIAVLFPRKPSVAIAKYLSYVPVKKLWFSASRYDGIRGDWEFP